MRQLRLLIIAIATVCVLASVLCSCQSDDGAP